MKLLLKPFCLLLLALLLVLAACSSGPQKAAAGDTSALPTVDTPDGQGIYEITRTDITRKPDVSADKISVFGIKLGMSKEEAKQLLEARSDNLNYKLDMGHQTSDYRLYVYDGYGDGDGVKNRCILYLIWKDPEGGLSRITFFQDFSHYLLGNSTQLLTTGFMDSTSWLYKNYLGAADSNAVTLNVPTINMKHVTYYYGKKQMELTLTTLSGAPSSVFAFVDGRK